MAFLKNIWKTNSKHKKLSEDLALQNANIINQENEQENNVDNEENKAENEENDVVTFKIKYLGSTVVEKLTGDSISTEAVKTIIKVAKASKKKLQRVNIAISLKGIAVTDLKGNDLFRISIYSISNCSTDPNHRQVFSFVSTDENETMECHAFWCNKRKLTETVTLAIAHAFSTAYEAWRILPAPATKSESEVPENDSLIIRNNVEEEKLIDFDDEQPIITNDKNWVCFDDDFGRDFGSNNVQADRNDFMF